MQHSELLNGFFGLIAIIAGYFLANFISNSLYALSSKFLVKQQRILVKKFIFYTIFLLFIALALQQIGFDISILLGTAGFLTVAIGFASKTVVSNFISGMFIIIEGAVEIGDKIQVGKHKGKLISIDLLSIKLKTSSQQYIRIPNESILKAELVNLSRSKVQRKTIDFELNALSDTDKFLEDLYSIIQNCKLVIQNPEPKFYTKKLQNAIVSVECEVWCKADSIDEMQSDILMAAQKLYQNDDKLLPVTGHYVTLKKD